MHKKYSAVKQRPLDWLTIQGALFNKADLIISL